MYNRLTFKAINYFLLFVILNSCRSHISEKNINSNKEDMKMLKACENYILNYSPLYYENQDTFVVARFNEIPDSINTYLIQCAKNNDLQALKYSVALIMRHNKEYIEKNKSDYIIGDGLVRHQNGFIVLLYKAIRNDDNIDIENYFPYYTGDICLWAEKNKKKIKDFQFVKKYKRKYLFP